MKIMKKLLATLGSLLIFAGLKAQPNTVKKETTPIKPKVQSISTNPDPLTIKNVNSKGVTVKNSNQSIKIVSPRDPAVKMSTTTIKGSAVTIKGNNTSIKNAKLIKLDSKQATIKQAPIIKK
jgi:hypothetical protein